MNVRKLFATNKQLEVEGKWIVVDGDFEIKLARFNNKNFIDKYKELVADYKVTSRNREVSGEPLNKIMREAIATCIVLDWKNFNDGTKKVPYSVKNAMHYLEEWNDFAEYVSRESQDIRHFQDEVEEAQVKN